MEPRVSQFWAMKETNNKNLCCSWIKKNLHAAQKLLLLFCAAHWNKQKYFNVFSLLWVDTKSTNCPGRAGFAKARYMKSFSFLFPFNFFCFLFRMKLLSVKKHWVRYYMVRQSYKVGSMLHVKSDLNVLIWFYISLDSIIDDYIGSVAARSNSTVESDLAAM